ncbi:uncharacterized protein LOC126908707 [Daktulosphaira vitifoliae]|uniref:uncharacterized protein LOC126908707 n=1 Tax=Daktulosphaira vitifoliae TaxID=58002 RepID=UPI0021AA177F|nr:uncharacterized protein LOC126908707 [Daktulosphaira vitifoliae]
MCGYFFEEVIGNILLIVGNEVIVDNSHKGLGYHTTTELKEERHLFKPSEKYLRCSPLILYIENKNEIFAEIYLNFHDRITRKIKNNDTIYFKISFKQKHIILNYNGNDNIFEYNGKYRAC